MAQQIIHKRLKLSDISPEGRKGVTSDRLRQELKFYNLKSSGSKKERAERLISYLTGSTTTPAILPIDPNIASTSRGIVISPVPSREKSKIIISPVTPSRVIKGTVLPGVPIVSPYISRNQQLISNLLIESENRIEYEIERCQKISVLIRDIEKRTGKTSNLYRNAVKLSDNCEKDKGIAFSLKKQLEDLQMIINNNYQTSVGAIAPEEINARLRLIKIKL